MTKLDTDLNSPSKVPWRPASKGRSLNLIWTGTHCVSDTGSWPGDLISGLIACLEQEGPVDSLDVHWATGGLLVVRVPDRETNHLRWLERQLPDGVYLTDFEITSLVHDGGSFYALLPASAVRDIFATAASRGVTLTSVSCWSRPAVSAAIFVNPSTRWYTEWRDRELHRAVPLPVDGSETITALAADAEVIDTAFGVTRPALFRWQDPESETRLLARRNRRFLAFASVASLLALLLIGAGLRLGIHHYEQQMLDLSAQMALDRDEQRQFKEKREQLQTLISRWEDVQAQISTSPSRAILVRQVLNACPPSIKLRSLTCNGTDTVQSVTLEGWSSSMEEPNAWLRGLETSFDRAQVRLAQVQKTDRNQLPETFVGLLQAPEVYSFQLTMDLL